MAMFETLDIRGTLLIVTAFLLAFYYVNTKRRNRNFPPGPYGLPLVGYLPFVGRNPGKTAFELSKKYGPVFSVNIGTQSWVILNDYNSIYQAFVKQGDVFSGRQAMELIEGSGIGILFVDYGKSLKTQRKFGLRTLRGSGMGKKSFECKILQEVEVLLEVILSKEGNSFNCANELGTAMASVICSLLGSRLSYDDVRFRKMMSQMHENFTSSRNLDMPLIMIMFYAPFLRNMPVFSGAKERLNKKQQLVNENLRAIIEEHRKSSDPNCSEDFLDEYLKELDKSEDERDPTFHELQLIRYFWDLVVGGTDTTSKTLLWCFLCMAHFPQQQDKLSKEVEIVLGDSGIPSMQHQDQMPFTCAFIHEIMRHRTLAPFSVPHKTSANTCLLGYDIPKDTQVIGAIWVVHNDPDYFKDPEEFRPERFLDDKGCFVPSDHVIPFSLGPRQCLGMALAKMELFLFLTSIVQKFKIAPDPQKPLPPFEKGIFGHFYSPSEFAVKFVPR